MNKNFVSCFDIGEVPTSPGKVNWNRLRFLPFIFIYEQCDTVTLVGQEEEFSSSILMFEKAHMVTGLLLTGIHERDKMLL